MPDKEYPHPEPPGPKPAPANLKIEAVITCVQYGDYLAWTLAANKQHFNRMVVVTRPDDKLTQQLCAYYHVECYPTYDWHRDDDAFNKAKGINYGLSKLAKDGWVVHLDADIYLPPRTRSILQRISLDPNCLYGLDRMECKSFADWIKFLSAPPLQHEWEIFVHNRPFPLAVRIAKLDRDGYVPIGYFQLWNPGGSGVYQYPEHHTTAARSDMLFAMQWPRDRRHLIPEVIAIHLESERADMGANWKGRTTRAFGP
ncbi:MAG: hypothetical protein WBW52_06775 [Desulfobaccales bacterium]